MSPTSHNPFVPLGKSWMCCRCQRPHGDMRGRRKTASGWACAASLKPRSPEAPAA